MNLKKTLNSLQQEMALANNDTAAVAAEREALLEKLEVHLINDCEYVHGVCSVR